MNVPRHTSHSNEKSKTFLDCYFFDNFNIADYQSGHQAKITPRKFSILFNPLLWCDTSTVNVHHIGTISKLANGWFWSSYSLFLPIRPLLVNVYFHQKRRPEDSICPKWSLCYEVSQFIYLNKKLLLMCAKNYPYILHWFSK